jgi:Mycoplasma protein of unknown function, DUF285
MESISVDEKLLTLLKKQGFTEEDARIELENRKKKREEKREQEELVYFQHFLDRFSADLDTIYSAKDKIILNPDDLLNIKIQNIFKYASFGLSNKKIKEFLYTQLRDIDLTGVTNMRYLFSFDVINVFQLKDPSIFNECETQNIYNYILKGVEDWNVSNVVHMPYMFFNRPNSASIVRNMNLDLTKWSNQLSKVIDMDSMFSGCVRFQGIGLNNWNSMDNVINMQFMFENCEMFNADLSSWGQHLSSALTMSNMFFACQNFMGHGLESWTTINNVKSVFGMFSRCENFNGNLSKWCHYLTNVEIITHMLYDCYNYEGIGIDEWLSSGVFPNLMYCESVFENTKFKKRNYNNTYYRLLKKLKSSPKYTPSLGNKYDIELIETITNIIENKSLVNDDEPVTGPLKLEELETEMGPLKLEELETETGPLKLEELETETIKSIIHIPKSKKQSKKNKKKNKKKTLKNEKELKNTIFDVEDEDEIQEAEEENLQKVPTLSLLSPPPPPPTLTIPKTPPSSPQPLQQSGPKIYTRYYHSHDMCGENFETLAATIEQDITEDRIQDAINRVEKCINARRKESDQEHQAKPLNRLNALRGKLYTYLNHYSKMYPVDTNPVEVIYDTIYSPDGTTVTGNKFRIIIYNINGNPNKKKDVEITAPPTTITIKGGTYTRKSGNKYTKQKHKRKRTIKKYRNKKTHTFYKKKYVKTKKIECKN